MKYLNNFDDYLPLNELNGDGSYDEGGKTVYGNRKNLKSGFDPYEYYVGPDGNWRTRKKPTKDNPKNIDWISLNKYYKGSNYCKIVFDLDRRFPKARTEDQRKSDLLYCTDKKLSKDDKDLPKNDNDTRTDDKPKVSEGSIPKDWHPKSGVIYVPIPGRGDITKGSRNRSGNQSKNYPWRGLPNNLVGKKYPKTGLEFLFLSPSRGMDFEDFIKFVEDGNLDFIRLSTIIIILWKTYSKGDMSAINKDVEDIKSYLGVTSNVNPLNSKDLKKVDDLLDKI
jgi:hypothetical protein